MKRFWWVLLLALMIGAPVAAQDGSSEATPSADSDAQPGIYVTDDDILAPAPIGPLAAASEGSVSVVYVSQSNDSSVFLVGVRNGTSDTINTAEVSTTVTVDGEPVALGVATYMVPAVVPPDGVGFFFLELEGDVPRDIQPGQVVAEVTSASFDPDPVYTDLRLVSAVVNDADAIVAVSAIADGTVDLVTVLLVCFDQREDGGFDPGEWSAESVDLDDQLQRGESETVSIDISSGCGDDYLVAVAGAAAGT